MKKTEQFFDLIKSEMAITLATASGDSVTMRIVSPVYLDEKILMFTYPDSRKYRQLKSNPNCCVAAGAFFAECSAEFLGATMLDENSELRRVYEEKFRGAFDENIPFGGRKAEFILLTPIKLKGWGFENDVPTPDGVPNVPFEIDLN